MSEELQFSLDTGSDVAPYQQLVEQMWQQVADGALDPGERLPTVRRLAIDLSVHPDTVNRAYKELELLGVVIQRPGEGTFVGLKPPDKQEFERRAEFEAVCRDVVSRAHALGFSLDELMETLAEFRNAEREREPGRRS